METTFKTVQTGKVSTVLLSAGKSFHILAAP